MARSLAPRPRDRASGDRPNRRQDRAAWSAGSATRRENRRPQLGRADGRQAGRGRAPGRPPRDRAGPPPARGSRRRSRPRGSTPRPARSRGVAKSPDAGSDADATQTPRRLCVGRDPAVHLGRRGGERQAGAPASARPGTARSRPRSRSARRGPPPGRGRPPTTRAPAAASPAAFRLPTAPSPTTTTRRPVRSSSIG